MENMDGWSRYERMVINRLENLEGEIKSLRADVTSLKVDIAMLKVKSGVWGLAGGVIPAALVIIVQVVMG